MEPRRVVFYSAGTPVRPLLAAALLRHDGDGRFAAFGAGGASGLASPLIGQALTELGVATVGATPVADLAGREYHAIVDFCDAGDS